MALLRHSGIYFLARILAGVASFAIIAAYTRLLDAHQFGELALALAGVAFFSILIVDGLLLALLRYLSGDERAARATMLWGLILPAAALCAVAAAAFLLFGPERWRVEAALCAGLLLAIVLHRFQLATAQGALRPSQYALLGSFESVLDMVLGIGLVLRGYGVAGALAGTMLAALITVAVNWRGWWIARRFFDRALGRQMLRFGLPLMVSALCVWLATFADRWLLGYFIGTEEAGLYAAGYDLLMNLLGVPIMAMQLAGVPLTVSALAERGTRAAQDQLRLLGAFIILILLPEAVGIVMTGPLLVTIFLGEQFRPLTLVLLPFLVGATFLKALMLYVNYGYFLAERTSYTLLSVTTSAVVNIGLNLVLIPRYGAWGAALAAVAGFGAAFAVASVTMRRVFPFPRPDWTLLAAGLAATAVMTAWLLPFYHATTWITGLGVVPIALLLYLGSVVLFLHWARREPLALVRAFWRL